MPLPPSRPLVLAALLALAADGHAGPGLLVRHADEFYQPPIRRTLVPLEALPAVPPEEMQLPFRAEDLGELEAAGYLEGYRGPRWDRDAPCTRYEAAFLLGGIPAELDRTHGAVLGPYRTGPSGLWVPPGRWGGDRVRLVLALGLLRPRARQTWWDEEPDRFEVARWMEVLTEKLEPRVVFLQDPAPYPETLRGDLPYYGHPMRRRVRRALETRLMMAPRGRFRGRDLLTAREWVRIVNRLRYVIRGYRTDET